MAIPMTSVSQLHVIALKAVVVSSRRQRVSQGAGNAEYELDCQTHTPYPAQFSSTTESERPLSAPLCRSVTRSRLARFIYSLPSDSFSSYIPIARRMWMFFLEFQQACIVRKK